MEEKQTINCTVESCKYNDCDNNMCQLKQIMVASIEDWETMNPDESMCASYEYEDDNDDEFMNGFKS